MDDRTHKPMKPAVTGPAGLVPTPGLMTLWTQPLPALKEERVVRWMCRLVTSISRRWVLGFEGLDHVPAERDPFILALNHSQRPEAVIVPTWLCYHRGGRLVHFLADWNFLLLPVVGWIIRLHDPIVVVRKDAKPRILNRFRSRFQGTQTPFEESLRRLAEKRSVGVFPEATTNRHPTQLLRGQTGVARLAIEAQVPVVPVGIRFPNHVGEGPIQDHEPFSVHIGPALTPPQACSGSQDHVTEFHEQIMRAISTLSGKGWQPSSRRTKYVFSKAGTPGDADQG